MTQTNKQETLAERRHRVWKGRGLCHAHAILRGVDGLCGSRETPGGPRLCEAHSKVLLDELKPTESVWINRRDLDRLRSESEQYADQRRRNRPLEDRVAELEREVALLTSLPPRERRKRKTPVEGHVYFLLSDSVVKIGWTSDLDERMRAYSPGARILAVMPGTKDDESRLHKKFGHLKTNRREWFAYSPQVMEEVARVVREHGDPPRELNEPVSTARIVGPRLTNYTQRRARSLH